MKLKDFIQDIGAVETRGPLDIDITAITSDSRAVTPGSLFIAVKGFASDGHKYIASAIEKGAVAIVCEEIPDQVRNDKKNNGSIRSVATSEPVMPGDHGSSARNFVANPG